MRPLDLASRYGGEEFALILPDLDCDAACAIADEIRIAVMALAIAHGAEGAGDHVTISVGVASDIPLRPTAAPSGCWVRPTRRSMRPNGSAATALSPPNACSPNSPVTAGTACRFLTAGGANQPSRRRRKRLPAPRQSAK